jgi:hypothetical protein
MKSIGRIFNVQGGRWVLDEIRSTWRPEKIESSWLLVEWFLDDDDDDSLFWVALI